MKPIESFTRQCCFCGATNNIRSILTVNDDYTEHVVLPKRCWYCHKEGLCLANTDFKIYSE